MLAGHKFEGWYIDGADDAYDFNTAVTSNLKLKAKWTRIYYTVTFDSNGGQFSEETSISVGSGETVSKPADPEKEGNTFDGWYIDGTGTAYNFSEPVNSNLTLVAKWTQTHFTVTFDPNEGQFSGATTVQVENGKKLTEPEEPT